MVRLERRRAPTFPCVRRQGFRHALEAAALAAALAGIAAPPIEAGAAERFVAQAPSAVRAYWTPARMRGALPGSLLAPGGPAPAATAGANPAKPLPLHRGIRNARQPGVRAAGKVFFSQGAYDYECSGTVVRAPSRSLVMSAGHCAYVDGALGGYGSNWMFVPAYRNGQAPFGMWTVASGGLVAAPGWVSSALTGGDSRYDVSAATMAPLGGRDIQDVVGARTPRFNAPRRAIYEAIGYPAAGHFDGGTEFQCTSPLRRSDGSGGRPATIGIGCDLTAGSSGGGWIVQNRYIESVTSYGYSHDPSTLYGPYFGPAIQSFYDSVKNG